MALSDVVRLDQLVAAVTADRHTPLDRVTGAVELAERLGETADAVVGHFVDDARRAGASWSQIGQSMGVSKQAAQKRFVARTEARSGAPDPSQGFSAFTEDARAVVVEAQQRARRAGNDTISVAHLVLALVADRNGTAAAAIAGQGANIDDIERTATATLPPPAASVPALIPFDAHARAALMGTFAEAERLGSDLVDVEHLLVAVLAVEDGTGVLAGHGVTAAPVVQPSGDEPRPRSGDTRRESG